MSETNCNCCCAYLTPPWWVTMGFAPPAGRTGVYLPGSPATPPSVVVAPPPPATTVPPPPGVTVTAPPRGNGGVTIPGIIGTVTGKVGDVIGTVGKDAGNLGKDIVTGNIGGVASDVVNGIGDLIHLL